MPMFVLAELIEIDRMCDKPLNLRDELLAWHGWRLAFASIDLLGQRWDMDEPDLRPATLLGVCQG